MLHGRIPITIVATALLSAALAAPAQAASLFPDLQTFAPRDLQFQERDPQEEAESTPPCVPEGSCDHDLLRFTNTVFNGGEGKLEVSGQVSNPGQPGSEGPAIQRIFDESGDLSEQHEIGRFYWHAAHSHYHFDDWGSYQLWTKDEYDAWVARGGSEDEATLKGVKTTSCVMDEEFVGGPPTTPFPGVYPSGGCQPTGGGFMTQGLSPGWGDTYDFYRAEQWIDLGPKDDDPPLADGDYVLRSVTDPKNLVYESPNKSDANRESIAKNEAITNIRISGGQIMDLTAPTGTVAINNVDESTPTRAVNVKIIGRDDRSGVDEFRIANSESELSSAPWREYDGTGSSPHSFNHTLSAGAGNKSVYVQLHDASGKLSEVLTDSIQLEGGSQTGDSDYSQEVLDDSPAAYWRLGEASGTTAFNAVGAGNAGTYINAPTLGQAGLVPSETNGAVRFRADQGHHVAVPHSSSLNPNAELTVEAWIKPDAIPAGFATVAAKPGAYGLQFNAGRLEFKVNTGGAEARHVAPAGAIEAGKAHHIVGTYDGERVRLYIEGALVNSPPALTGDVADSGSGFSIASWNGFVEFLTGTIDDVAVYGSALSGTRVAAHRQAANVPPPPPPPPTPTVLAPSGLSAMAKSTSEIQLSWNDNSNNESKFLIERSTSPAFSSKTQLATFENQETFTDRDLAAGTTYYYRVKAHMSSALVDSGWSNVASATTGSAYKPPVVIPPTPKPVFPPAKVSFTGAKSVMRTDSKGRLTYRFRVSGGTSGMAKFLTRKAVRVSSKSRRKRNVTLIAKAFKVPGSGKVVLKLKLSKSSFAILKRNKTVYLKVRVGAYGKGPARFAEKRLTLKAPKR